MADRLEQNHYDVVVVGGGSAGVAAALAAAQNGASTLLVEAGSFVGGELISGIPFLGSRNAQGEKIVGGVADPLFDKCKELDGYVGAYFDWRLMWGVCFDPEVMKLAIVETLSQAGVKVLLYSFAQDVIVEDNRLTGIVVNARGKRLVITANVFVDASGDGDVAALAGAPFEMGGNGTEFQPVSLTFRIGGVDTDELLEFARTHPDDLMICESPVIHISREEAAEELAKADQPFFALTAEGPLLKSAIAEGRLHPTMGIYIAPTSVQRREVVLNTTRVANVNATDSTALSATLSTLTDQIKTTSRFLKESLPGFSHSHLGGVAPRIGIRETRRIIGEHVLTENEVLKAQKSPQGIAKGSHHIDIHGDGTDQVRQPVEDGGSYDIPYGCLVPQNVDGVLVAGRCISSTRLANGSARVMGTCMATGQAAGTAAALSSGSGRSVRDINVDTLRTTLMDQGAILTGTK